MNDSRHIFRRPENLATAAEAKSHPLNPRARRKTIALADVTGLTSIGVHLNLIAPGDVTTEAHSHELSDEFIYIISGNATVYLDEVEHSVSSGDFIGFPARGPAHWMKNTGSTDLVYLVGGGRPDFDICNYPRLEKRLYIVKRSDGRHHEVVDCRDINKK